MKLKQARRRRKRKQWEVAKHCNISTRFYQYIESGESIPPVKLAIRICRYLEVSPLYIDEWADDTPESDDDALETDDKLKDTTQEPERKKPGRKRRTAASATTENNDSAPADPQAKNDSTE